MKKKEQIFEDYDFKMVNTINEDDCLSMTSQELQKQVEEELARMEYVPTKKAG